jgi:hypothetical protein
MAPAHSPLARRLAAIGLFVVAGLSAGPASAEIKGFRDWIAACDNTRICSAYGFDADIAGNAYVRIELDGAADAAARITVVVNAEEGVTFRLRFDDAVIGGLPPDAISGSIGIDDDLKRLVVSNPEAVEPMLAGLRKAKKLIVTRVDPPGATPSDPVTSEISLSGMVAALLWMDDQQKRVGTVTALVGRGDKPAAAVPAPPAPPVVTTVKVPGGPSKRKPPAAVIAKARAICEDKKLNEAEDTTRLAGDEVMYWFPCRELSGAYNFFYALLVDAPGKPVHQVEFKMPQGLANTNNAGVETNMNPGFDDDSQTLSMLNKGRGISDCGTTSDWAWDGRAFQMIVLKSMPECKGVSPSDWPTLYRAERK